MSWIKDDRTDCWSVMQEMEVGQYLDLIQIAHRDRGGIEGQRDVLKTTTAKRIRDRMVTDIQRGAVLPPVVIGAVVSEAVFRSYPAEEGTASKDLIPEEALETLAIIDGMQRTGALMEAAKDEREILSHLMRVEFWITPSVRAMVYRMLVLNTGQVPWTLARQLSVVYAPLIAEVKLKIPGLERVFGPDGAGRRVGPAQFSADAIVELYLAFSLRKTTIDTKEALSEEFSRLDFVENLSRGSFQDQFYSTLELLALFDRSFSKFDPNTGSGKTDRYIRGKNIFDSQPARIGFVVAVAQFVLGRPGSDRAEDQAAIRMDEVQKQAGLLIARLDAFEPEDMGRFLVLDVLRERLDVRSGQVGRFERAVFFEAFKVLIDERFTVTDMEQCWRAH